MQVESKEKSEGFASHNHSCHHAGSGAERYPGIGVT